MKLSEETSLILSKQVGFESQNKTYNQLCHHKMQI